MRLKKKNFQLIVKMTGQKFKYFHQTFFSQYFNKFSCDIFIAVSSYRNLAYFLENCVSDKWNVTTQYLHLYVSEFDLIYFHLI
jgi:hypothetical protein